MRGYQHGKVQTAFSVYLPDEYIDKKSFLVGNCHFTYTNLLYYAGGF